MTTVQLLIRPPALLTGIADSPPLGMPWPLDPLPWDGCPGTALGAGAPWVSAPMTWSQTVVRSAVRRLCQPMSISAVLIRTRFLTTNSPSAVSGLTPRGRPRRRRGVTPVELDGAVHEGGTGKSGRALRRRGGLHPVPAAGASVGRVIRAVDWSRPWSSPLGSEGRTGRAAVDGRRPLAGRGRASPRHHL